MRDGQDIDPVETREWVDSLRAVLEHGGSDRAIYLLDVFCVGGTMLGCTAAVLAGRGEDKIASLTFLATMLDFSDAGEIGLLVDDASVAARVPVVSGGVHMVH
jgi:poly(3-hydroxyalkanoate) synthetase